MNIELKNIKHSEFASHETFCYQASLYIDGKKVGTVSNDGHGGADMFHGDNAAYTAASQALADASDEAFYKNYPSMAMESKCAEIVADWLTRRDIKRALKRRIMFTKPGEDGIYQLAAKYKPTEENIKRYRLQKPEYRILNTLSVEEILPIWQ